MIQFHLILRILMVALSLAGLADALYFTLAYYGRVRKARWVPEILCAREGTSCVRVVQTPYARVLGMPNSLLGIFYYLLLIGWALEGGRGWTARAGAAAAISRLVWMALVAISLVTVLLGAYLVHALGRKLHTDCPLCYTAHAINVALMVLLVLLSG